MLNFLQFASRNAQILALRQNKKQKHSKEIAIIYFHQKKGQEHVGQTHGLEAEHKCPRTHFP